MFEWMVNPESWIALGTLVALEIVLGVDNIIFISILVGRLPSEQRNAARQLGIGLAMFARIALLFSIVWVMRLVHPWFTVLGNEISGRDVILVVGGLCFCWPSRRMRYTPAWKFRNRTKRRPGRRASTRCCCR